MPPWVLVVILSIVFTAVLATGQGLYWAWVAKKEREQEELLRRLGSGTGPEEIGETALFRSEAADYFSVKFDGKLLSSFIFV